jgi:hypothetical protein
MKRFLIALGLGAVVFGGIFGLAAGLNVSSTTLGAGNATVASCQTSGTIGTTYAPAYSSTIPGYDAVSVTLSGIHANCNGKSYKVTLTGAADAALGTEATGTVSGTSANLTFTGVEAAEVTGVHVTIYG